MHTPRVAADAARDGFCLSRRIDEAHAVAQPFHRRAGDEDAAFEGERRFTAHAVAHRGEQPRLRQHLGGAGVRHHEAARAVGALRHANVETALADERRLLIAGHAEDGDLRAQPTRLADSEVRDGILHFGQHGHGHVEVVQQRVAPSVAGDVVELRAGGVGGVRAVALAAREPPDEEGVHGAKAQFTGGGAAAEVSLVEQPRELRAGEVGIDQQPRDLADALRHAFAGHGGAALGSAAVLPADGGMYRGAGLGIPQHRGLALVGDADGGHLPRLDASRGQGVLGGAQGGAPEGFRVLLHPTVRGEGLVEGALARGHDAPVVKDDGARAGRALVDGEDVRHGASQGAMLTGLGRALSRPGHAGKGGPRRFFPDFRTACPQVAHSFTTSACIRRRFDIQDVESAHACRVS